MSSYLDKIGFHEDTVTDAIRRCCSITDGLNIDSEQILKDAMQYLPDDLTNMFISAFYTATKEAIETKREDLGLTEDDICVETDVNDSASQISVINGNEGSVSLYDGDDIQRAFENAVWNHYMNDEEVHSVIEECIALLTEADCGRDYCLSELESYAKCYVDKNYRYDEYETSNVKEGFLHETAEWVMDQLESKGFKGKVNIFHADNEHLYLNGKQYESQKNMLKNLCNEGKKMPDLT